MLFQADIQSIKNPWNYFLTRTHILIKMPTGGSPVPVDHIHRYDVFEALKFADDECTVSKGTREGHVQVIPARLSLEPAATVS